MTVAAYVGNFTRPWCTEVHVAGSLEQLGHTVHRWQENEVDWRTVPDDVDRLGVQVLLWTRTWPADLETVVPVLDELWARGVPSVSYHLDRWFGLDREHQVEDQPFFRTSLVVSPDDSPKWAEHDVEHLWLPPGVYGPECVPVAPAKRRWPWDVVFVGSFPYPHPEWRDYRADLVHAFQREFGRRFQVLPRKGQPIRNRQLQELYATVPVVVGDSCLAGESHGYWSDRIPETLGRGGALIHPVVESGGETFVGEGGSWYEHGRDLLTYPLGDFDEAVGLAKHLLAVRADVGWMGAVQGRELVLGRDTYAHRLATVLEVVEERFGPLRPSEPRTPPVAPAPEVGRHRRVRAPFSFQLAQGDTDRTAVREVWQDDTYRVRREDVAGRVVVDVGANVGAFSVLAALLGARRVVAYEPHPETCEALRVNVAKVAGVEVRQAAVGGVDGVMRLVGDGGGATLLPAASGGSGGPDVPVEGIAGVLGALGGRVGLLKLDCEGGEYAIVEQLPFDLVDRIVGEWHGPGMPHLTDAMLDDFRPGGWRFDEEQVHRAEADLWVEQVWSPFVARLADHGRLELFGHPKMGGTFSWRSY